MIKIARVASVALVLALPVTPASANKWFMNVQSYPEGLEETQCVGRMILIAKYMQRTFERQGRPGGVIGNGERSIVLDGVGSDDVSVFMHCSPKGMYIFTGTVPGNDRSPLQDVYVEMLNGMSKYHPCVDPVKTC